MSASILSDKPASPTVDVWGALLSLGCVVHCLAAPLSLLLIPAQFATWIWSPAVHAVVAVLTSIFVLAAIVPGYREHGRPLIPFLATLGCGLVILGCLWPCGLDCVGSANLANTTTWLSAEMFAATWTPVGAGLLVLTHWTNSSLRSHSARSNRF